MRYATQKEIKLRKLKRIKTFRYHFHIPLSHTTAKINQKVVYTTFSGKCITLRSSTARGEQLASTPLVARGEAAEGTAATTYIQYGAEKQTESRTSDPSTPLSPAARRTHSPGRDPLPVAPWHQVLQPETMGLNEECGHVHVHVHVVHVWGMRDVCARHVTAAHDFHEITRSRREDESKPMPPAPGSPARGSPRLR